MEVTFNLRTDRADNSGYCPIHGRVCWQSRKVRFSTRLSCRPADWQAVRVTDAGVETLRYQAADRGVNRKLSALETAVSDLFARSASPTPEAVRAAVDETLQRFGLTPAPASPRPSPVQSLRDFFARYRAEMGLARSRSWHGNMVAAEKKLFALWPDIGFADLTISRLNEWKAYLMDECDLSDNTVYNYVTMLHSLCDYAERSGIDLPRDWRWLSASKGDSIRPHLSEEEVRRVFQAEIFTQSRDYRSDPCLKATRWFFALACRTGLRHVDLWQLLSPRLVKIDGVHCLKAYQQKVGSDVAIPLDEETHEFLLSLPPRHKPPGIDVYGPYVRRVAQIAGLDRSVTSGTLYGRKMQAETGPLHTLITGHTARHTFGTLMLSAGLSVRAVQILMGHASISSTEKYTHLSDLTLVRQTMDARRKLAMGLTPGP